MTWQAEMRADILRVVIERGQPADMEALEDTGHTMSRGWTYSSVDYRLAEQITEHRLECGFAFVDPQALPVIENPAEWDLGYSSHLGPAYRYYAGVTFRQQPPEVGLISAEWSEFAGTFTGQRQATALLATASCACGRYKDVVFLYEADLAQMIRELTA